MKNKTNNNLITIEDLAREAKVKINLLSRYVREQLLPYEEQGKNGKRFYDKKRALGRIAKIKELEKEGYTKKEMQKFLSWEDIGEKLTTIIMKDPKTGKKTQFKIAE